MPGPMRVDLRPWLGRVVEVVIDRPAGSVHPDFDLVYPIDYGYLPGTRSGDGEEVDAYVLGSHDPLPQRRGRVVAVVHRADDVEDKLVVALTGTWTQDEVADQIAFQERYFRTAITMWRPGDGAGTASPAPG